MDNTNRSPLARLPQPLICYHCRNLAYWIVHNKPLCYLHLRELADTGKGIATVINDALISPVITAASINDVTIAVYPTTCIAPICAMLNRLPQLLPGIESEAEICIELWQDRPSIIGPVLQCEGRGYYSLDSTTIHCHAPLFKLARPPIGRMAGFMKLLNDHSLMVRKCVRSEFAEEAANG